MRVHLRRIAPLRAANICALLYAFSMLIMVLILLPIFWAVPVPVPAEGQTDPQAAFRVFRFMMILYPLFGLAFGWVAGCLGALIYNLVSRWVGGLDLVFAIAPEDSTATVPAA